MAENQRKYVSLDSLAALVSKITTMFAPKSHTHNYAGSASVGGSATSAVKLDTLSAGSSTQPVYFNEGKPTACSHTLGKSVPSDAVFTDHKTPQFTDDGNGNVTLTIV